MNQLKFLANTCELLKARENSRVHSAIGFGFVFHWLKNWREIFKPITKCRNCIITSIRQSFENYSTIIFNLPG